MTGPRISEDVKKIVARMGLILPVRDIITYTGLSERTIQRIIRYHRTHGTVHKVQSGQTGRPQLLNLRDKTFLYSSVSRAPDRYLEEIQEELEKLQGIHVSLPTLSRHLRNMGFTMKKITKLAIERSEEKRAEFMYRMGLLYMPEQLVFVDESSCDRRSTFRNQAWAIKGERVRKKTFFVRGKRYSVLPALSLDAIIYLKIVEGSFDTMSFIEFIDGLLDCMNPYPERNSVLIMDNCRIHKSDLIREMVEARGMRIEYLPAYSPDYNPIELFFSAMKANIRRNNLFVRSAMQASSDWEVYHSLHRVVYSATPEDAAGWFRHCGYF